MQDGKVYDLAQTMSATDGPERAEQRTTLCPLHRQPCDSCCTLAGLSLHSLILHIYIYTFHRS
jgi:hypothetical protein